MQNFSTSTPGQASQKQVGPPPVRELPQEVIETFSKSMVRLVHGITSGDPVPSEETLREQEAKVSNVLKEIGNDNIAMAQLVWEDEEKRHKAALISEAASALEKTALSMESRQSSSAYPSTNQPSEMPGVEYPRGGQQPSSTVQGQNPAAAPTTEAAKSPSTFPSPSPSQSAPSYGGPAQRSEPGRASTEQSRTVSEPGVAGAKTAATDAATAAKGPSPSPVAGSSQQAQQAPSPILVRLEEDRKRSLEMAANVKKLVESSETIVKSNILIETGNARIEAANTKIEAANLRIEVSIDRLINALERVVVSLNGPLT